MMRNNISGRFEPGVQSMNRTAAWSVAVIVAF